MRMSQIRFLSGGINELCNEMNQKSLLKGISAFLSHPFLPLFMTLEGAERTTLESTCKCNRSKPK